MEEKRIETKNMYAGRSITIPSKYYWSVISDAGRLLISGYTDTFDYAVRAARNYMKRNQNEVFDVPYVPAVAA